jgi:hypothetical protein
MGDTPFSDDPLSAGGFGPGDSTIRVRPGPVRATFIQPRVQRIMAKDGWITPYPACPCIRLIVPTASFAVTLEKTGVGANPDWVERMKEGWETDVLALLDVLFNGTWTQKALFSEIQTRCAAKKFEVLIFPRVYRPDMLPSKGKDEGEIINIYLNSVTSGPVSPEGENALIYFDPATWRSDSIIRIDGEITQPNRFGGAAMEPGDNLFHELVHVERRLKGVRDRTATRTAAYNCVEEFAAVLFTNIGISEAAPFRVLRYCETTFMPMPPQYQTSAGYLTNAEHIELIKKIQTQDPGLCSRVASSVQSNPFNPFRRLVKGQLWKGQMADW